MTEHAGESAVDALHRRLESSEVLLVLDNFESALDAAPQVAALVERCPRLKVLTTSRERLNLGGEREYRLDPLGESDASDLFAARASAARPDLHVDAAARRRRGDLPDSSTGCRSHSSSPQRGHASCRSTRSSTGSASGSRS